MATQLVDLPGSHRTPPAATRVGATPPDAVVTVSIYLKNGADDPLLALPPQRAAAEPASPREGFVADRGRDLAPQIAAVTAFAAAHGLTVVYQDATSGVVRLAGPAAALEAAFATSLHEYDGSSGRFRARTGFLRLPADVAGAITAVLGLDTRPIATPKLARAAAVSSGFRPNAVGAIYGFPQGATVGAGTTIGLIELGGGFRDSDTAAAFAAMNLPPPTVIAVGVDGGVNDPATDPNANGEVALDIQVAGGVAPGAKIAVYFAPNTDQGFVDAISAAVHDTVNTPSVISISWGSAEPNWTPQALAAMTAVLKDAATLGVTIFAASGDNLATDGVADGHAHVDFPASSPYVVGCGGTRLTAANGTRVAEQVWNSGGGGTGGGVSAKFARPAYQNAVAVPAAPAGGGRGVPDVAGNADPATGYLVVVDGKTAQIGGTSAVAPLWAGLFSAIGARSASFVLPVLYGNMAAFNDITDGDNKVGTIGFAATPGWDACTGLGSPQATALLRVLARAPT